MNHEVVYYDKKGHDEALRLAKREAEQMLINIQEYNAVEPLESITSLDDAKVFLKDMWGYYTARADAYVLKQLPAIKIPSDMYATFGVDGFGIYGSNDQSGDPYFDHLSIGEDGSFYIPESAFAELINDYRVLATTKEEKATYTAIRELENQVQEIGRITDNLIFANQFLRNLEMFGEYGINPEVYRQLADAGFGQ